MSIVERKDDTKDFWRNLLLLYIVFGLRDFYKDIKVSLIRIDLVLVSI